MDRRQWQEKEARGREAKEGGLVNGLSFARFLGMQRVGLCGHQNEYSINNSYEYQQSTRYVLQSSQIIIYILYCERQRDA